MRQLIKKANSGSKICAKSVMKRNHYFLNIQLTPDNSNPKLEARANSNIVDFSWISFTVILPSVTRTLDNSSLPLSRSNFCFPSAHFCTISPWIYSNHRYKRVTSRVKNRVLKSETLNLFQNNRVNSLSLLFCHSSSNSVSIPVYFFA